MFKHCQLLGCKHLSFEESKGKSLADMLLCNCIYVHLNLYLLLGKQETGRAFKAS